MEKHYVLVNDYCYPHMYASEITVRVYHSLKEAKAGMKKAIENDKAENFMEADWILYGESATSCDYGAPEDYMNEHNSYYIIESIAE